MLPQVISVLAGIVFAIANTWYWIIRPNEDSWNVSPKIEAETKWLSGQFQYPCGITIDSKRNKAYVINNKNENNATTRYNMLFIIDLASGKMSQPPLEVGLRPQHILYAPKATMADVDRIFIQCENQITEVRITGTGEKDQTYTISENPTKFEVSLTGMWLSHDGRSIFATSQRPGAKSLFKIDITSKSVQLITDFGRKTKELIGGNQSISIETIGTCSDRWILVPNYYEGTISVLDAATNRIALELRVGGNPTQIAVDRVSERMLVSNSGDNTISICDLSQVEKGAKSLNCKTLTLPSNYQATTLLCSDDGKYTLAICRNNAIESPFNVYSEVVIIDNHSTKLIGRIGVFNGRGHPSGIFLSSTSRCFVVLRPEEQIVHFDLPSSVVALENAAFDKQWWRLWENSLPTKGRDMLLILSALFIALSLLQKFSPLALIEFRGFLDKLPRLPDVLEPFSASSTLLLGHFAKRPDVLEKWVKSKSPLFLKAVENEIQALDNSLIAEDSLSTEIMQALTEPKCTWIHIKGKDSMKNRIIALSLAYACSSDSARTASGFSVIPVLIEQESSELKKLGLEESIIQSVQTAMSGIICNGERIDKQLVQQLLFQKRLLLVLVLDPTNNQNQRLASALCNPPTPFSARFMIVTSKDENDFSYMSKTIQVS